VHVVKVLTEAWAMSVTCLHDRINTSLTPVSIRNSGFIFW